MSGVFLNLSLPDFLRPGLLLNLELTSLARLADQQAPGILLSPPFQCDCGYMLSFLSGNWGSKLRASCLCTRSLPTLPSPQTQRFSLLTTAACGCPKRC